VLFSIIGIIQFPRKIKRIEESFTQRAHGLKLHGSLISPKGREFPIRAKHRGRG